MEATTSGVVLDISVADAELKNLDASEINEYSTQRKFSCQSKEMSSYPHAQVEQSSWQEQVKNSEHPPTLGCFPIKEQSLAVILKEQRTDLLQQNNQRMGFFQQINCACLSDTVASEARMWLCNCFCTSFVWRFCLESVQPYLV